MLAVESRELLGRSREDTGTGCIPLQVRPGMPSPEKRTKNMIIFESMVGLNHRAGAKLKVGPVKIKDHLYSMND